MLTHPSKGVDIPKQNDIGTDLFLKFVSLIDEWNYCQELSFLIHI